MTEKQDQSKISLRHLYNSFSHCLKALLKVAYNTINFKIQMKQNILKIN